jgi:hypothetical protein
LKPFFNSNFITARMNIEFKKVTPSNVRNLLAALLSFIVILLVVIVLLTILLTLSVNKNHKFEFSKFARNKNVCTSRACIKAGESDGIWFWFYYRQAFKNNPQNLDFDTNFLIFYQMRHRGSYIFRSKYMFHLNI